MVVETARNLLGLTKAHSTEFDPDTPYPILDLMNDQRNVTSMGGTMRLGIYPCDLMEGTIARAAYGTNKIFERHRHRFELNNAYREALEEGGLRFSGLSPDQNLVEIAEVVDHPFMLGTQFHPEFLSRPNRPHPLFQAFINTAKEIIREGGQTSLPFNSGSDG